MQRQKEDIEIYQGNDEYHQFNITEYLTGAEKSLAGATSVTLTVKQSIESSTSIFSETAIDGVIGSDFANGIIVFKITKANSVLLTSSGVYDIDIVLSNGDLISPCYGDVLLQRRV